MKEHLKIYFKNYNKQQSIIRFAIRETTGTDTAFPANEYNLFDDNGGNL